MEKLNAEAGPLHIWMRTQANAPAQRPWFRETGLDAAGRVAGGRVGTAQMKPLPAHVPSSGAAKPKGSPLQLAADANHKASQAPDKSDYFNAIVQYAYEPGTLYQVYAQPMRITDIALEPGEKILGEPASGDVVRWLLALGKSMQGGVEQWHVYPDPRARFANPAKPDRQPMPPDDEAAWQQSPHPQRPGHAGVASIESTG